jgi:2-phosphoglycerate kinase
MILVKPMMGYNTQEGKLIRKPSRVVVHMKSNPSQQKLPATISFAGAWLTDIDDTLIPSGACPDDVWINRLVDFIRVLKSHDILWAPVSGVSIEKMGERLLYRLPEDILSHVRYYGGEGSMKHFYDFAQKEWVYDESFCRHFSDAQAIALIGEKQFTDYLLQFQDQSSVKKRIQTASKILQKENSDIAQCHLIQAMEQKLQSLGADPKPAETYYRGGAISWMMLGDRSVVDYKGIESTQQRLAVRDFASDWLEQHHSLKNLGEYRVCMPYKHATRGIKIVLEKNDKGRAVDDLVESDGLQPSSILFMGNELFDGGNDNPVRRIPGIRIISVGEYEDTGVIDGGVLPAATEKWMSWFENILGQGERWNHVVTQLEIRAKYIKLIQRIDKEKANPSRFSHLHPIIEQHLSSEKLAELILQHFHDLENTRYALVALRNVEYQLLARLAVLPEYHYDEARKIVCDLSQKLGQSEKYQAYIIVEIIKDLLISELKTLLKQSYMDNSSVSWNQVNKHIDSIKHVDNVLTDFDHFFLHTPELDFAEEKEKIRQLITHWEKNIHEFVDRWFCYQLNWKEKKRIEQHRIFNDPIMLSSYQKLNTLVCKDDMYYYFCRMVPRLFNFPHIKELTKPTIVLVAGTSGVGKSALSQHVSKNLGISTYFTTDVTSRSVMRSAFSYLLGDTAEKTFPSLYQSSFDGDSLQWFYTQSLLSMIGTKGSLDRLIEENVSAVIDGVSLIPGSLEEHYFEDANIIWIVTCIKDRSVHYQRMDKRDETGVSRGGAERYKKKFSVIRNNHDRLVEMGKLFGCFIIDNGGVLQDTLQSLLQYINTPFSHRGSSIEDDIRDGVLITLKQQIKKKVRNH